MIFQGYYGRKDKLKSEIANKFIGYGAKGSSTDRYRKYFNNMANTGKYNSTDIIFVSINGKRPNRIGIEAYKNELTTAIKAGVTFVTDNPENRNRNYNIGEREIANFLRKNNYYEEIKEHFSLWKPKVVINEE